MVGGLVVGVIEDLVVVWDGRRCAGWKAPDDDEILVWGWALGGDKVGFILSVGPHYRFALSFGAVLGYLTGVVDNFLGLNRFIK